MIGLGFRSDWRCPTALRDAGIATVLRGWILLEKDGCRSRPPGRMPRQEADPRVAQRYRRLNAYQRVDGRGVPGRRWMMVAEPELHRLVGGSDDGAVRDTDGMEGG